MLQVFCIPERCITVIKLTLQCDHWAQICTLHGGWQCRIFFFLPETVLASNLSLSIKDKYLFRRLWKQDSIVADDSNRVAKNSWKSCTQTSLKKIKQRSGGFEKHTTKDNITLRGVENRSIPHTCNERVSIKSLKLVKFTAIHNSGNNLQHNVHAML